MIKLLGFLIIVASSAKIGFDISDKYRNRTREIKAFITILEKIKNEISFSNCIISEALEKSKNIKCKTISSMIDYILNKVEKNRISLAEAFNFFLNENNTSLTKTDTDEILKFFAFFGNGDKEDEIKNINSTVANMRVNLQSAIEDEKKYVKLFRTSGFLAGCLIAIILA